MTARVETRGSSRAGSLYVELGHDDRVAVGAVGSQPVAFLAPFLNETQRPIERQRRGVIREDAQADLSQTLLARPLDDALHNLSAYALTPERLEDHEPPPQAMMRPSTTAANAIAPCLPV